MTACGGNFIGGEISRNKQCPHQADLRRLRLRTTGPGAEFEAAQASTFPLLVFNSNFILKNTPANSKKA
jgi:hypothetical protein